MEQTSEHGGHQTRQRDPVAKAFGFLVHMVEAGDTAWSARQMAAALDMPVSTVHRTLTSLCRAGILEQDPKTSHYFLGQQLHRIARLVTQAFPLPDLARRHLEELTLETDETSLLGVYDANRLEMMFISQVEGSHRLRYVIPLHEWVPLNVGASGLSILSFLDSYDQERILDKLHEQGTDATDIRQEMNATVDRGYAISYGQRISAAVGLAAPIYNAEGRVLGDILLTIPEVRFSKEREPFFASAVIRCARNLSAVLGGPSDGDLDRTG